jgi:hypothetical protein
MWKHMARIATAFATEGPEAIEWAGQKGFRKKSENAIFRHSGGSRNPVFSLT